MISDFEVAYHRYQPLGELSIKLRTSMPATDSSSGFLDGGLGYANGRLKRRARQLLSGPTAALVRASSGVGLQDWVDHYPGGLDRVLTGE
jgi:hypothetical protein